MRRRAPRLPLLALAALAACADPTTSPAPRVAADAPQLAVAASPNGRYLVLAGTTGFGADFASTVAALGGTVDAVHAGAGIAVVSGLTSARATSLAASRGVVDVQPDAVVQIAPVASTAPEAVADALPRPASATDPTLAARYARQWDYPAISAPAAWAAGKLGSPEVKVAILDSGIDYGYPDLVGRVDLANSTSFVATDDALVDQYFPGKNHCTDLHFHGTHVASTVASNSNIIAGVTTKTTLLCVKVLGVSGSGSFTGIFRGILFAADHGADVINASLGADILMAHNDRFLPYLNRIVNYAYRKGALMVVSAGNEALDLDHNGNAYDVFCNSPNVVCVAATGPTAQASVNGPWTNVDAPTSYTNFGRAAISVAAPGGSDVSFVWQACSRTSLVIPICQTGTFILAAVGTSMASPHVSGLAALLVAEMGHGKPAQIRARLLQSADDLGQVGVDPFYGRGRINVKKALGL